MRMPSSLVMAVVFLVARAAPAAKIFVSTTGDDANDGLSWAMAKASPRAALDLAHSTIEADSVHVAEGTYILSQGDGVIRTALALLGGYPPDGGTARDPRLHPTVLDLAGINSKLLWFYPESDGASIDGFTLRRSGCGLAVSDAGPLIRDCIIEQNVYGAGRAPGLTADYSSPDSTPLRVEDCVIRDNRAGAVPGPGGWTSYSAFSITATPAAGDFDLGLVMSRTLIQGNFHPSDLAFSVGSITGETARIRDVALRDNPAEGPLYTVGVDMVNVLATGGIASVPSTCWPVSWRNVTTSSIDLRNCDVSLSLTDSIVWGTDPAITGLVDGVVVANSIVQGGWPSGTNVIDADPLFTLGTEGDFYLSEVAAGQSATSPAVDAGSELAAVAGLDTYTTRTDSAADVGMVDLGYHSEIPPTGGLALRRGPVADGLSPYRPIADLPFTDTEGTLTGPWFRRLFYDVPDSSREIIVRVDRATDAVRVEWR